MKKMIALLLAAMMCLSLAACGSDKAGAGENDPQEPKTEATDAPGETKPAEVEPEVTPEPEQEAVALSIGDTIDNENFSMSFDSMEILDEFSYKTSEYSSTSLYVEEGYKLLLVKGHIENKSMSAISDSSFARTVVVNGGYTVTDYDVRLSFKRDKYFEIDPYTDLDYFLYINIPEKLAAQFETATFTLGFNDDMSYPEKTWNPDGTTTTETDKLYALTAALGGEQSGAETGNEEIVPVATGATALAVGEVVTTDVWEITVAKAEIAEAIYPVNTGASGIHYESSDGYRFINLEFDLKNLDTDVRAFADAVSDVVVHCGKYDYSGYEMFYDMGGSLSVTMLKGTTFGPNPLDTTRLYVETQVPEEALSVGSITVDLTVAGGSYCITVQ